MHGRQRRRMLWLLLMLLAWSHPGLADGPPADGPALALDASRLGQRLLGNLDRARRSNNQAQQRCLDQTLREVNALRRSLDPQESASRRTVHARQLATLKRQAKVCAGSRGRAVTDERVHVQATLPIEPHDEPYWP